MFESAHMRLSLNIIKDLAMRVNKQKIQFELYDQDGEVILRMDSPYDSILSSIQIKNYSGWINRGLSEVYSIIHQQKPTIVTFSPIYLLRTIDHTPLKEALAELFDQFVLYSIFYQVSIYGKQMKMIRSELKDYPQEQGKSNDRQKVVFYIRQLSESFMEQEMRVFCHRKICETVMEEKVDRLKRFIQEEAVYDLEEYFYQKNINQREQKAFVKALIGFYKTKIPAHIQDRLKTYGMDHQIFVKDVEAYLMDDRANSNSAMKGRAGIHFTIYCFEEAISKMYRIFEKWLNKLNWMALEVEQITCCKPEEVQSYFLNNCEQNIVRLPIDSQGKGKPRQRIIVFEPKQSKNDFQKMLETNKRLITGREFADRDFSTIFQFKKQFEIFIANDNKKLPRPIVYEDYILVQCDKNEEQRLRSKIKLFLQEYMWETVDLLRPAGEFQIEIFTKYYSSSIEVQIRFIIQEEPKYRLQRQNLKKYSEAVEEEIKELYYKMRRQLVTKPLMKPFKDKQPLFRVLPAPQWKSPECLKSGKFKINDEVDLIVRSYGSLTNGQGNCIFLLYEPNECSQFQQMLEEEGMSYSEEKFMKNPIMNIQLKYSPVFDGITSWLFQPRYVRNRRDNGWIKRMKIEIGEFLADCKNMSNINFMLPHTASEIIEHFLPCLIDTVLSEYKVSNLRQITLFTSLSSGPQLRNSITKSLKTLSQRLSINRVSELLLLRSDIEKIIEYKYFQLQYLETQTLETTALNSFIFKHQREKKCKTPIFLPSAAAFKQRKLIEYLVCLEDKVYIMIRGKLIGQNKYSLNQNEQLKRIAQLVSKVFVNQNYLIVFGDQNGKYFDCRLFMTSDQETDYKKLSELEINVAGRKILPLYKKLHYEIIQQQYIELFKVQTHPNLLEDLKILQAK